MYEVLVPFTDLLDGRHVYGAGDVYPRSGAKASAERINELLGENNKLGKPLIKDVTPQAERTEENGSLRDNKKRRRNAVGEDSRAHK